MAKRKLTEREESLLTEVVEHFCKEDMSVRERQIRTWRQLKLFWENFQRNYYSEVAHDWRIYDIQQNIESDDQAYYDKPVNVFRAYLESIIAALSVTVPPIKCFPDDADNPLDLSTAKAGDKIAQLIYRHNDAPLLWLHALFVFCTEGMVAAHHYSKSDKAYGEYEDKQYEEAEEYHELKVCPNCGNEFDDRILSDEDEFAPEEEIQYSEGMELCPECESLVQPELQRTALTVTRLVGVTKLPKSRQCIEVYGGLNVKVPNYARKQSEIPYLSYSYETHYANVLERFEHLRDESSANGKITGGTGSGTEPYERWARIPPQYQGEYPINNVTVRETWLRPAAFNILSEDECKKMKKMFPSGAKVTLVNEEFAEAINCALDDEWTLSYNPLSDFIHHDPIGLLLVSIQEITNDLISLVLQTIEHGIPQTMVDPAIINAEHYRKQEATPGALVFTKPLNSGKKVSDGFYEVRTATLSQEVLPFANMVQELGQLVSGALPSLFGGALQGGGETASEYSMSRAQALQRQQTTWKMMTFLWKNIFGKVIPAYIDTVVEDEKDVQRLKDGSFVNVFIRKAELEGKIGKIELEANENLPLTWSQIKDVVMQLLNGGNPEILEILGHPENLHVVREAIGLTDFYIPGEDQVNAEHEDILACLNSVPIEMPPDPMQQMEAEMMGQQAQPIRVSSVDINPEYDEHSIRFECVKKWVVSDAGRLAKVENPEGYENVLLHGKAHLQQMQMQMMQEAMQQAPEGEGAAPNKKPNPKDKEAPIEGEGDVRTMV